MRIKIDENLSAALAEALRRLGHDADTVVQERLGGCEDPAVWAAAQQDRRLLITQDMDFSDIRLFRPGRHQGLVLVRLRRAAGAEAINDRILEVFRNEDVESWRGCLVVVSDQKVRIIRAK